MVWYILQNYHSRCLYFPESTPKVNVITINIQEAWEHEILFPVITDIYSHAIGLPYCFDVENYKVIRLRLILHCIMFQMLSTDHILLLFLLNHILLCLIFYMAYPIVLVCTNLCLVKYDF